MLTSDRSSHNSFEFSDHVTVLWCDQCERITLPMGAAGAADAMDISVGCVRHIVIDDVRNALHVQSACSNVRGNHDVVGSVLKSLQSRLPLALRSVPMQTGDLEAGALNLLRHLVSAVFCARKDQNRAGVGPFQQFDQERRFQMRRYRIQGVGHRVDGTTDPHRDALRMFQ